MSDGLEMNLLKSIRVPSWSSDWATSSWNLPLEKSEASFPTLAAPPLLAPLPLLPPPLPLPLLLLLPPPPPPLLK